MKEDELPPGWAWSTLGQVATWGSGGTPKAKNPQFYGGDIPWAVIGDLTDGLVSTTKSTITREGLDNSSAKLVPEGAVLIAMYGSIGKLGIVSREMATNQAIAFAVPNPAVMRAKYLFWYLRSQRDDLIAAGKGGTQQNISQTVLKSWRIAIPPVAEQERIVDSLEGHLSRLNAAVAYAGIANSKTDDLRASWVSTTLAAGERSHDWKVSRLGDISRIGTGATPKKARRDYYEDGEIPWVTSGQVNFDVIEEPRQFITDVALRETSVKLYPAGTLLVAMYGEGNTRGRSAELGIAATINQACAAIQLNPEFEARKPWIRMLLEFKYLELRKLAAGGVQPNLNLGMIRDIQIPLPPISQQQTLLDEFDSLATALDYTVVTGRQVSMRADRLRRVLVREAFAGRLVPQGRFDEPASVLLERIKVERASQPKPTRKRAAKTATASTRPAPSISSDPAGTFVQEELGL